MPFGVFVVETTDMPQLSKSTLFNFFAGNASPLQQKLVEEWLKEDKNNTELYYEWLEEWEREHPQFLPDTQEALQSYLGRIHSAEADEVQLSPAVPQGKSSRFWIRIAAAVALLFVSAFLLNLDLFTYKSYHTTFGELRTIELEDGSRVTLNANSTLRVPRFGFGRISREVLLEGEAEFVVEHTHDDKKFLVHTPDNLEVEVVGTEFIVFSRDRGSKVVLNKGKVLLRSLGNESHELSIKPGDVVTIRDGVFDLEEAQPFVLHAAWKDHRFVFDRASLREIAAQLKERLNITLIIDDSTLADRKLTGTLEASSSEEVFDILSKVLHIKITLEGNHAVVEALP